MIYLNGDLIKPTIFPDGTSQIWKIDEKFLSQSLSFNTTIKWVFEHEAEFLQLAQLKDLLDSTRLNNKAYVDLEITYLPYARQDKKINNNNTFALNTFSMLLNSLNFSKVTITDPHSDAAESVIENCVAIYPRAEVSKVFALTESKIVAYPDEGAFRKYTKIYDHLKHFVYGEKVRDQSTGQITDYTLYGNPLGEKVLIVDDICDGGATFQILAGKLLSKGALEVNLFVTHGIFSKGLRVLKDAGIKRIFTKDGEAFNDRGMVTYMPYEWSNKNE